MEGAWLRWRLLWKVGNRNGKDRVGIWKIDDSAGRFAVDRLKVHTS
jgi:hypothetical protein